MNRVNFYYNWRPYSYTKISQFPIFKKTWRQMKFFLLFLMLGEVRGSRNMKTKFCWDASQLRYEAELNFPLNRFWILTKFVYLHWSPPFHKSHDRAPPDESDAGRCIEGFDGRPHLRERWALEVTCNKNINKYEHIFWEYLKI